MKSIQLLFLVVGLMALSCSGPKSITADSTNTISKKEDFHLYLLMGQSNMAGRGKIEALDTLTHPRVFMLDSSGNWVPAQDPMHFDKPIAGAGLGLTFGKIMANENPAITIGLIPTAVGGSSIDYWVAGSLYPPTKTHPYDDMMRRAREAMQKGTLKGILWHQGESDSDTKEAVKDYPQKFETMLGKLQEDLGLESLPVVMGEIGYFYYTKAKFAEEMNTVIRGIADSDPCIGLVTSQGLAHKGDSTHFDSNSYHALGIRYAAKMQEIQISCPIIFNK